MALIRCPECSKEISDKATQCIHCGFPLPAAQMADIRPERYVPVSGGRKKNKRVWLLLLAALLLALACVAGFSPAGPGIELPYGIRPGMSMGEMQRQMEDHGFDYTHEQRYSDRRLMYFDAGYVRGQEAAFALVTAYNDGRIEVSVFYEDAREHGRQNPSARFNTLRGALLEEYGKPATDFSGVSGWKRGSYRVTLSYMDNTGGVLWLTWFYEP